MNGQTVVEHVREQKQTELDRLASDKVLIAATEANLDADAVGGTILETERALADVYSEWAERAATEDARETFGAAAETATENADRLAAELSGDATVDSLTTVTAFDQTIEAVAGGLVGQSLVLDGSLLQTINFFVNEADERRADILRDVRSSVNNRINDGSVLLNTLCTNDDEWSRADGAAVAVVEAAYGEYAGTLGEMGIDPKPVC